MKQARSESLGAYQHWDLVKWSLVTLCSTGEEEPPLTPLTQCLALVQPHTPSPTSILVQCMKWELHQWALLDCVDTAVGVENKLQLIAVSVWYKRKNKFIYKICKHWLYIDVTYYAVYLLCVVFLLCKMQIYLYTLIIFHRLSSSPLLNLHPSTIIMHTNAYKLSTEWVSNEWHLLLRVSATSYIMHCIWKYTCYPIHSSRPSKWTKLWGDIKHFSQHHLEATRRYWWWLCILLCGTWRASEWVNYKCGSRCQTCGYGY